MLLAGSWMAFLSASRSLELRNRVSRITRSPASISRRIESSVVVSLNSPRTGLLGSSLGSGLPALRMFSLICSRRRSPLRGALTS